MLLVFGSINLDIVVRVPHLPAPGETVLGGAARHEPGGKGANQAHAARLFGTETRLVGAVGSDPFGARALERLRSVGVDLTGVRTLPGAASGLACIAVSDSGENAITVAPGANSDVAAHWVDDDTLAHCRVLLLQGEVPLDASLALARRCRALGGVVLLNPSPMPQQELQPGAVDWLIVNATEMAQLCERHGIEDEHRVARGRRLAQRQHCAVLMTLGAAGALIVQPSGAHIHCPALCGTIVDTTGAGDTLAGVFAAALAQSLPQDPALRYAVVASGLACRRPGAQAAQPERADIDAALALREV
jgi:ribokinase